MRNLKKTRFFSLGRKWVFTLALFLLVFAAASAVKIHAAGNVTGWLWGGGAGVYGDGTNTNVRWISMNSDNDGISHAISYGVNIPASDCSGSGCKVTGYAWSGGDDSGPGLGWIDFNPQDNCGSAYAALSCYIPGSSSEKGGVFRSENMLIGWARIVGIAKESAVGNSGGWSGWIHMNGSYGIDLLKMTGTAGTKTLAQMTFSTAGSDELAWIDASRAKAPCTPLPGGCGNAISQTYCPSDPAPSTNLCNSVSVLQGSAPSGSAPWNWQCVSNTCPGTGSMIASCPADYTDPEIGKCGIAATQNFCGKDAPSTNLCADGTTMTNFETGYSEYTWSCGKTTCGGTVVECSAPGIHCGWKEVNP